MKALHYHVFCMKTKRWILMTERELEAHERRCHVAHMRAL